jgi:hypothetical protein
MKTSVLVVPVLLSGIAACGCTADVTPTEDSQRVSVEVPKVDVGDDQVDLDPGTDDDVDVDTPLPGDQ